MKILFTAFYFISLCTLIYSQTKISGVVTDNSGSPLPGANIFLKDTYDGVSSDAEGIFNFSTEEKGDALLVVSFVGYKDSETKIFLEGKEINLNIILEEELAELGTVVISAGAFEASDEKKSVMLRPLDIVSTADADIYSTLETLPGTQQVGETEGLFVRGGSAGEAKTIIDEMVVQNPFYTSVPDVPSRGRFSPFLFKGTIFSTGGYSAQYGQALSSALILKTEDLPAETITAINILPLGFGGSHIHRWENSSVAFEGFYSNLGPYFNWMKQRTEWDKAPSGYDFSGNFRQKVSSTGILKLYTSVSLSDLSLNMQNLNNLSRKDHLAIKTSNYYVNASYRDIFGDSWVFFSGISYSFDRDKYDIMPDDIKEMEELLQGKITVTKSVTNNSFLTFGAEAQKIKFKDIYNQYNFNLPEVYSAGYAEADIFFTNDLAARIGLRAEYSKIINESNIAPRVSLAYRLGTFDQLNFAYGDFYQTPDKDFLMQTTNLQFEKATHYILNYQYIDNDRTFRIEAYYKEYDHLAKGSLYDTYNYFNLPPVVFSNNGSGYAKGIDIFWRDRKTLTNTDYWVSYSYLDTKRDFRNYPNMAYPTFATPHTFSIVAKHWFEAITTYAGLTYSFATGRPYFNPNNPEFLSDRAKNYNNLSLNFSYVTSILGNFSVVFVSIDNIPGFTNIYGYRYSTDGKIRMPIEPTALRTGFFGLFISIGQTSPLN